MASDEPGPDRRVADLVQRGHHDPLALDLPLPQAHKLIPGGVAVHHSLTDMNAHREAVALHAAGCIDCVTKETIARTLHAYHPSIGAAAVHPYRAETPSVQPRRLGLVCNICKRVEAVADLKLLLCHSCCWCTGQKSCLGLHVIFARKRKRRLIVSWCCG